MDNSNLINYNYKYILILSYYDKDDSDIKYFNYLINKNNNKISYYNYEMNKYNKINDDYKIKEKLYLSNIQKNKKVRKKKY